MQVYSPIFLASGNNLEGANLPNVASAATITLPGWADTITVSGATQINSITAGGVTGRPVRLIFTAASPAGIVPADANLIRLASSFTPAQYGSIVFVYTNNRWVEVARSN